MFDIFQTRRISFIRPCQNMDPLRVDPIPKFIKIYVFSKLDQTPDDFYTQPGSAQVFRSSLPGGGRISKMIDQRLQTNSADPTYQIEPYPITFIVHSPI